MQVSIAMATYNGAKYLQEQLDSLTLQTRQPDELVVCDDGSNDATIATLEQFAVSAPFPVRIHRNQANLGCTRNFEKALSLCTGDYVFLSDQDDVWRPAKISSLLAGFERHPGIHLLICDADYTDEHLNGSGMTVMGKVTRMGQHKSGHIAGACTAVSRKFLDFVLPFPVNCPIHDGYLHRWANLMDNKLILEESLQAWRIHGQNTSSNEMTRPEIQSLINRYASTKHADTAAYCRKKAEEYAEMLEMLDNRQLVDSARHLTRLPIHTVKMEIRSIIEAHLQRAAIMDSGWMARKALAVKMLLNGNYRYFNRHLSFAKDILR